MAERYALTNEFVLQFQVFFFPGNAKRVLSKINTLVQVLFQVAIYDAVIKILEVCDGKK